MRKVSWHKLEFAGLLAIVALGYVSMGRTLWSWLASWF